MKPVIVTSLPAGPKAAAKAPARPLIRKTTLTALLERWKFNRLDKECVLDLAPSYLIEGEIWFDLPAVEKLLERAYWVGTDAPRHLNAAA